jgi:hypothetical protein
MQQCVISSGLNSISGPDRPQIVELLMGFGAVFPEDAVIEIGIIAELWASMSGVELPVVLN